MLKPILSQLDKAISFKSVSAHCDVPCGIYDPIPAQIAAMTVARMTDTLLEKEEHEKSAHAGERGLTFANTTTRMIAEKERAAEIVKAEVRIIWGDFFKADHFKNSPELHNICHDVMTLASKCKQNVDAAASRALVAKMNDFANAFWGAKNIETKTVKYHCKPNLDITFPNL